MDGQRKTPSPRRVVVLASDALDKDLPQGLESATECIAVTSAYEACAELLAAPTAALVVDLRLLRPGHVRLARLACSSGTELLGIGPLPAWASSDQLTGMRLVGRDQLAQALGVIADRQPNGQAGAYEGQAAPQKTPAEMPTARPTERLLTTEELNALLGDAT